MQWFSVLKGVFLNNVVLFASNQTFCPPKNFCPFPQFLGWLRHWLFAPPINISGYAPDTRNVKKRSCELYCSVVTKPELNHTTKLSVFKSVFVRFRHMVINLKQGWRTCGPQKNFVRPAKHSGETSSYYFRLLFVSVDEQFFSFLTGFLVWLKSCAARLLSGNWQSGPR